MKITGLSDLFWLHLFVQVQHQDLKASHSQLALTLEDHKSALAAAQVGRLLFIPVTECNIS